jgi:hypothetical protein
MIDLDMTMIVDVVPCFTKNRNGLGIRLRLISSFLLTPGHLRVLSRIGLATIVLHSPMATKFRCIYLEIILENLGDVKYLPGSDPSSTHNANLK